MGGVDGSNVATSVGRAEPTIGEKQQVEEKWLDKKKMEEEEDDEGWGSSDNKEEEGGEEEESDNGSGSYGSEFDNAQGIAHFIPLIKGHHF